MITRVFRRKGGSPSVTVSVSFTDMASARRFARAMDRIKAQAACEGRTFSRQLLAILTTNEAAPRGPREAEPCRHVNIERTTEGERCRDCGLHLNTSL